MVQQDVVELLAHVTTCIDLKNHYAMEKTQHTNGSIPHDSFFYGILEDKITRDRSQISVYQELEMKGGD